MQSGRNSTASTGNQEPPGWDGQDRRAADRRDAPTRPWTSWRTPFRREAGRRDADRSSYVDRYTKWDVVLLLTIFMLNVGDAYFTMRWLSRGGREANPVMDFFLDIGPTAFLVQKCLVVGGWLLILLVHKNFRFARLGLYASLAVYAFLMIVHFGIVLLGVEPPTPEEILQAEMERDAARGAVEVDSDRNAGGHGGLDAAYRASLPSRNAGPFRFKTDAQSTSE